MRGRASAFGGASAFLCAGSLGFLRAVATSRSLQLRLLRSFGTLCAGRTFLSGEAASVSPKLCFADFTEEQACAPDFMDVFTQTCQAFASMTKFLTMALELPW